MHLLSRRPTLVLIGLAFTGGAAVAGCGSDGTTASDAKAQADQIVKNAEADAAKIRAEAQVAEANAADTASSADAADTSDGSSDAQDGTDRLPKMIGKGLQFAQDSAQAAGFYNLTSHDATGRGRQQLFDRNWKVCSQSPNAGATDTSATVDYGAVKTAETCPARDQGNEPVKEAGAKMPSFVGKSASAAEDALPGASIDYVDGTGDGRVVIVASNWRVCKQQPSAGRAYEGVPVKFTVVKYGESC